jgi:hypothetical protein
VPRSEWGHLPHEALRATASLWSNISSIDVSPPKHAPAEAHVAVDDEWLEELAKSHAAQNHLQELNLSGCPHITLQGLRHLKAFPHLRYVPSSTPSTAAPLVTPPAHDAPSYHGDLVYALRRKLRLKRPENAPEPGEDDTDLYQVLVASCPMLEVYYHARHTLTRTLIS